MNTVHLTFINIQAAVFGKQRRELCRICPERGIRRPDTAHGNRRSSLHLRCGEKRITYPPPCFYAILRSYGGRTLISECVCKRFYGDYAVHGIERFSGGMLKRNTVLPSFVR